MRAWGRRAERVRRMPRDQSAPADGAALIGYALETDGAPPLHLCLLICDGSSRPVLEAEPVLEITREEMEDHSWEWSCSPDVHPHGLCSFPEILQEAGLRSAGGGSRGRFCAFYETAPGFQTRSRGKLWELI